MKYKVAISDFVFPNLEMVKRELKNIGAEVVLSESSDEASIIETAADADALLICYAEITEKVIKNLKRCRIISRTGIGVNNIDIPAATAEGIVVTNVSDYCIEEVSDQALTLLLNSARKTYRLINDVKNGRWDYSAAVPVRRLAGQTLGVIGFGRIPRRLVEKVQSYNFNVLVYDPYVKAEAAEEYGVKLVELDELLRESDLVSVHAPLTKETEGLLGYEQFKLMKEGAFLVNTSRGGLIDEEALYRALEEGQLAGAALDVLSSEEFNPDNPLIKLDNVVITPHAAWYSEEALEELQYKAVQHIIQVLTGEPVDSCVNPGVLK